MIWKEEKYRQVLYCGHVDIGAIYPPRRNGRLWHWRIWINRTGHLRNGCADGEAAARNQVEERFVEFLDAACLSQMGSAA